MPRGGPFTHGTTSSIGRCPTKCEECKEGVRKAQREYYHKLKAKGCVQLNRGQLPIKRMSIIYKLLKSEYPIPGPELAKKTKVTKAGLYRHMFFIKHLYGPKSYEWSAEFGYWMPEKTKQYLKKVINE